MILTVHDELLFEAPEGEAGRVAELVGRSWSAPTRSTCPSPWMWGSAGTGRKPSLRKPTSGVGIS